MTVVTVCTVGVTAGCAVCTVGVTAGCAVCTVWLVGGSRGEGRQ